MGEFNYIKKEWKKLGSISLILVGVFLIIEHIYTYGKINLFDILGHELIGIILIISGSLTAHDWGFDKKKAWEETKGKIKYIFGKK